MEEVTAEVSKVAHGASFYGATEELATGQMPEIKDEALTFQPEAPLVIPEGQHYGGGTATVDLNMQTPDAQDVLSGKFIYTPTTTSGYSVTQGEIITRDSTEIVNTGTQITLPQGKYGSVGKYLGDIFIPESSYTPTTTGLVLNTAGKYISGNITIEAMPSGAVSPLLAYGWRHVYDETTELITAINVGADGAEAPGYLEEDTYVGLVPIYTGETTVLPGEELNTSWEYMPSNITIAAAPCSNFYMSSGYTADADSVSIDIEGVNFTPNIMHIQLYDVPYIDEDSSYWLLTGITYYSYSSTTYFVTKYRRPSSDTIRYRVATSLQGSFSSLSSGLRFSYLASEYLYFPANCYYEAVCMKK